ncbi:MAG: oxidative damage protection protein [Porticoccaceae bacterium]|jgi:Fe-S cluster biosynthesis and repair protein YggX|nr:oxidative damage protection protein [Porticoccaceae bacterium]MBT7375717.1 oxidative damage protection protein [Porticoccaceae bacterium]MDC0641154.1 oxidative damage protection protein [Porticoccaceae bacterium]MDG1486050.1 oxidative damage protection protein [Porticoccaceae bacterium]
MARTVFCRKLKQELPGLDLPPFPGPKGEEVFNNISKQAWGEWMQHQTTLINEMRLNMMDLTARTYLAEQREKFFAGEQVDQAEGYVPPSE